MYQKISPVQVKLLLERQEPLTLLDVRTEEEYRQSHLRGATLIPVEELGSRAQRELPDKNRMLLVHCRSGVRSARAAAMLLKMGYTCVLDFGGLLDWPYPEMLDRR